METNMKHLMTLLCAAALLLPASLQAQSFDDLLDEFGLQTPDAVQDYVQPLGDVVSQLALSGSFHNGRSKSIAGLDVGIRFVLLPFSSGDEEGILAATDANLAALPMLTVNKGLLKGFQLGARFMSLELSEEVGNLDYMGASLRWEFNEIFHIPLLMPRVGLQVNWNRLKLGESLETEATSFELIVSKSFVMLEPYAAYSMGEGTTKIRYSLASGGSELGTVSEEVESDVDRLVFGLNFTPFPMLRINAEAALGNYNTYTTSLILNLF
jgi:hypothetical protein